jgi:hypothetical protein
LETGLPDNFPKTHQATHQTQAHVANCSLLGSFPSVCTSARVVPTHQATHPLNKPHKNDLAFQSAQAGTKKLIRVFIIFAFSCSSLAKNLGSFVISSNTACASSSVTVHLACSNSVPILTHNSQAFSTAHSATALAAHQIQDNTHFHIQAAVLSSICSQASSKSSSLFLFKAGSSTSCVTSGSIGSGIHHLGSEGQDGSLGIGVGAGQSLLIAHCKSFPSEIALLVIFFALASSSPCFFNALKRSIHNCCSGVICIAIVLRN